MVECHNIFNKGEVDCDVCFKIREQILRDEIDGTEFLEYAIENFSEMVGYIAQVNLNIRIQRDITGLPIRTDSFGRATISVAGETCCRVGQDRTSFPIY